MLFKKKQKEIWTEDSVFLHFTGEIFGIGCSAFSAKGIVKIKKIKKRDKNRGFILLIPDITWLERYEIEVAADIKRLMQQFWPGNLTFVLKDLGNSFKNISYESKIAIRVPTSRSLREFIREKNTPMISTSVNISGYPPLKSIKDIQKKMKEKIDYFLEQDEVKKNITASSTIIDVSNNELSCLREGSVPFAAVAHAYEKPTILFMCTANICRSPMAHYLLKDRIERYSLPFRVTSAGFLQGGIEISENSFKVLQENEIEIDLHLSTQITDQIALDSWLILTMTRQHKERLSQMDPKTENKVFTLTEFTDKISKTKSDKEDIEDPYMMDIEHYRVAYKIIKEKVDILTEYLKSL